MLGETSEEPRETTSAGEQYAPKAPPGDLSNPRDVIPGTGARQVPDTDGPPYLTIGALVLVVAALITGRCVLRR